MNQLFLWFQALSAEQFANVIFGVLVCLALLILYFWRNPPTDLYYAIGRQPTLMETFHYT